MNQITMNSAYSILSASLMMMFIYSCSTAEQTKVSNQSSNRIEYGFVDSSVQPQYHRSYTVVCSDSMYTIDIHVYGDTLSSKAYYEGSKERFAALQKAIGSSKVKSIENSLDDECVGGTSLHLRAYIENELVLKGYSYRCMGEYLGTLHGDLDQFKSQVLEIFPEISESLSKTEK